MDDETRTLISRFRFGWQSRVLLGMVIIAGLMFLLNACSDRIAISRSDQQIDAFFEHVQTDNGQAWLEEEAPDFVATLPKDDTLRLAERALTHPDAAIRVYGLQLIYTSLGSTPAATRQRQSFW